VVSKKSRERLGLMPASLSCRLALLAKHHNIAPKYYLKLCKMFLTSISLAPINFLEKIIYQKSIRKTILQKPPIFIIGHWRSGTTHLHNLMVQDPQFAYASTFQVVFPEAFITLNPLKGLISKLVPETRQFDNVKLSLDYPQEDEVALAYMTPYSIYHGFFYPSLLKQYCDEFVTLQTAEPKVIIKLKNIYFQYLKKLAFVSGNKQLILKNPINTGRIPFILDLFPDAKFIHIYRDPYKACLSECEALKLMVNECKLEDDNEIYDSVIRNYSVIMGQYLKDKDLISDGQLVEVKFEELVKNPLPKLEEIYQVLQLGDFQQVRDKVQYYLNQEKDYQRNEYYFTPEIVEKIKTYCAEILNVWRYPPPL